MQKGNNLKCLDNRKISFFLYSYMVMIFHNSTIGICSVSFDFILIWVSKGFLCISCFSYIKPPFLALLSKNDLSNATELHVPEVTFYMTHFFIFQRLLYKNVRLSTLYSIINAWGKFLCSCTFYHLLSAV